MIDMELSILYITILSVMGVVMASVPTHERGVAGLGLGWCDVRHSCRALLRKLIYRPAIVNKRDGIEVTFLHENSRHLMLMSGGADKERIEWMCSNLEDWGYRVLRQICKAHYIDGVLVKGERP